MTPLLLCQRMQERLPRELRDMVYRYILPADSVRVWLPGPEAHRAAPRLFYIWRTEDDYPDDIWKEPAPYGSQEKIFGKRTNDELLEYLYRHTRFDFDKQLEILVQNIDLWPWTASICNLSLSLVSEESLWGGRDHWERERILKLAESLCTWPTSLNLTIFLLVEPLPFPGWEKTRQEMFLQRMKEIFPVLQRLQDAGHQVSVILNPSFRSWEDVSYDCHQFAHVIDTTHFTHVFNPNLAEFSPQGYMDKLLEYDRITNVPLKLFNENFAMEWDIPGI